MFKVTVEVLTIIILAGAVSCGSTPAGPEEVAQSMFEAAQAHQFDKMKSFLSPDMQGEINEAALAGIELVSFSIDKIDYSTDSTSVEMEYTITTKNIRSGETEVENDDMDLELNANGEWIIVDL